MFTSKHNEIKQLAELLKIQSGNIVSDVGAGKGEYTIGMSQLVGQSGKIFAVEFDAKRLGAIRDKISDEQIQNVEVIQSSETSINVPPAVCDAIFLRGVYHHLTQPQAIVASLYAALKPGAKLAIIDFSPTFFLSIFKPVKGVSKNRGGHGIPKDIVIAEVTAAGFNLKQQIDSWPGNRYCLLFEKP